MGRLAGVFCRTVERQVPSLLELAEGSTGPLSVAGGFRRGLMKPPTVHHAIRASILFVLGGEVSLYKQRGGLEDDAGLGSAQSDEPLAEIDDEVAQFGQQIATNRPLAAVP